jgi:cell division protease FtsH
MAPGLGPITYEDEPHRFLGNVPPPAGFDRRYSDETAQKIDGAVRDLVERAFEKAVAIVTENRAILDRAAGELLQRETLSAEDLSRLIDRKSRLNQAPSSEATAQGIMTTNVWDKGPLTAQEVHGS